MTKSFIFREYKQSDVSHILKLRGLVLSGEKNKYWWLWQHRLNPAGDAIVIVAELKENGKPKIVGHSCYLPYRVKVHEEFCCAVTEIDTMVHPDYRGHRIYSRIRGEEDRIARLRNYHFNLAFPNEKMLPVNKKHGVQPLFKKTPLWVKPINIKNMTSRYLGELNIFNQLLTAVGKVLIKITNQSGVHRINTQVNKIDKIDERFDNLWRQAYSLHKIIVVRDRAYLNWRYIAKPDADYTIYISEQDNQLLGYIVLRTIMDNSIKIGWIADILTNSRETTASTDLISRAIQHFTSAGVDLILCVMPPKAYLIPSLRRFGFLYASRWQNNKDCVNCRSITSKFSETLLHKSEDWFLTRGDSDLI
jgi:hypothetical protein